MKQRNSSLKNKVWLYLIVFSIMILSFLWFFQIIFLNTYYEMSKRSDINKIASQIKKSYKDETFVEILDKVTFLNDVCIELSNGNLQNYSINYYDRGCVGMMNRLETLKIKQTFIDSGKTDYSYLIKNKQSDNRILVKALKLDEHYYVFITTSLAPVSSTTSILASQLIYVTILVFVLSFVVSYFISKRISKPIIKLNTTAKKMAKGDYQISFETGDTIQEIEELATTLNQTKDELSKTDELRRELMANVSHDLKTPLTMIKAYAEMVRDLSYHQKEKREKHLNTIIDETNRLNLLVNDILQLSKMQSNVVELSYETFDLSEIIHNIINKFSYLTDTAHYHFIYEFQDKVLIYADKKKMEQVIYNLVSNAINHVGKDKKIIIEIEEDKQNYLVKIKDHGVGISNEEMNLIWDKYYKANKQYKRDDHGTGLGLSIVKNILELHNYKYGVKSVKNKGTTFYFYIKK